jgi:hypothetical protein
MLIALVAAGFVPYTSSKSYTWASEAIVDPRYPGPTTADHMPIVSAVAMGDCSGLLRHDSEYGARPLVRYSDGHLGSSAPLLATSPCVIGKTPMRNDLLVAIGVMALVSAAVAVASSRRQRRENGQVPAPLTLEPQL